MTLDENDHLLDCKKLTNLWRECCFTTGKFCIFAGSPVNIGLACCKCLVQNKGETTKKIGTPDDMLGRDENMDQTQKNKEFVIRHFEALNQGDVETVKANMSPALFDHELEGDHQHDVEEGGKRLWELKKRIPDLKVELRDVIADRDKVIVRAVWSGRDVQSGSAVEFHGFVEWRIADGKFVERWATVTPLAEVKSQLERW